MLIIKESHLDHGLSGEHIAHIEKRFASKAEAFTETFELPKELGAVVCALRGPLVGDPSLSESEVHYRARGNRPYSSRLTSLPAKLTRLVTVIAGPYKGHPCVLYTAFGGPLAPKEPGDPSLSDSERKASEQFWAQHALAETC